jgi:hypothetical protein
VHWRVIETIAADERAVADVAEGSPMTVVL